MMEAQVQESVQLLISGGTSISQRGETNINKAGSERDVRQLSSFPGKKIYMGNDFPVEENKHGKDFFHKQYQSTYQSFDPG